MTNEGIWDSASAIHARDPFKVEVRGESKTLSVDFSDKNVEALKALLESLGFDANINENAR